MFYLVLLLLVLVGGLAVLVMIQNFSAFLTDVQLTFIIWHVPPLPLGLLVLLALFCGGLLLYLVALVSARRDREELQRLRARVRELGQVQTRITESVSSQPSAAPQFSPSPQLSQPPIASQFSAPSQLPQSSQLIQPPQQSFPPPIVPIPGLPNSSGLPSKMAPQPPTSTQAE